MSRIAKVLGVLVLVGLFMVGCTEQEVSKDKASTEVEKKINDDKSNVKSKGEEKENKVEKAKVGETLNVNGVKITITGIKKFEGEINPYSKLAQDHAVQVGIIAENTNKEAVFIDSTEFVLYDADGFETVHALPSDIMELSTELPGGKKVKGSLFFDVPKQDGTWEINYLSMSSFKGEPAIWEVPSK